MPLCVWVLQDCGKSLPGFPQGRSIHIRKVKDPTRSRPSPSSDADMFRSALPAGTSPWLVCWSHWPRMGAVLTILLVLSLELGIYAWMSSTKEQGTRKRGFGEKRQ